MQDSLQLADSVQQDFMYYVGYGIVVALPFIGTGLIMLLIYFISNRNMKKKEGE